MNKEKRKVLIYKIDNLLVKQDEDLQSIILDSYYFSENNINVRTYLYIFKNILLNEPDYRIDLNTLENLIYLYDNKLLLKFIKTIVILVDDYNKYGKQILQRKVIYDLSDELDKLNGFILDCQNEDGEIVNRPCIINYDEMQALKKLLKYIKEMK